MMDQDILTDIILEKPASEWPAVWAAMRLPLETLPVRVSSMVQSRLDEALKAKKKKSWTLRLFERRIASGFVLSGICRHLRIRQSFHKYTTNLTGI